MSTVMGGALNNTMNEVAECRDGQISATLGKQLSSYRGRRAAITRSF